MKWDEEQQKRAVECVQRNSAITLPAEQVVRLEQEADANWNAFYDIHQNKFFKNRHWYVNDVLIR